MISYLFFAFVSIVQQPNLVHFEKDEPCLFNETEKQTLERLASELKGRTGLHVLFICRGNQMQDEKKYQGRLVIFLDSNPAKREIGTSQNTFLFKEAFLNRLKSQFLAHEQNNEELIRSLSYVLKEIENFWTHKNRPKQKFQKEEDELSPEFWTILKIYSFLIFIYAIWAVLKWRNSAHNKAEYWEHYGYNRLPVFVRYTLWVITFCVYLALLNHFIFYYSEIFILLIPLGFLMRPSVMLVSSVIAMVLDWRAVKQMPLSKSQKPKLSLGQKLFVLNPKSLTEELMLMDIIELILREVITLDPVMKDGRYGYDRYHNFLSVNEERSDMVYSTFQRELLPYFSSDRDRDHVVAFYIIKKLVTEVGSFKKIRKDLFVKNLVDLGLISQKSWVINQFQLTEEGLNYRTGLDFFVEKMDALVGEAFNHSEVLGKIKKEVLLISDYEQRIEDLYTHLVNIGGQADLADIEIAPLLAPSFSFSEFRTAIYQQINKIHRAFVVDEGSQKGVYYGD